MSIQTPVSFLDKRRMKAAKPPKGPVTVKVEHRAGVRAPAEVVWEVLADLPGWAAWNPLHRQAEGAIRIGQPLSVTQTVEGAPDERLTFTVADWVPNEQLHLKRAPMGGWLRAIRFIEIDTLTDDTCILSAGDLFIGMFANWYARKHGRVLKRGFTAHNEALKAEAERRWAEPQGSRPA